MQIEKHGITVSKFEIENGKVRAFPSDLFEYEKVLLYKAEKTLGYAEEDFLI